jgi:hypothetical protein
MWLVPITRQARMRDGPTAVATGQATRRNGPAPQTADTHWLLASGDVNRAVVADPEQTKAGPDNAWTVTQYNLSVVVGGVVLPCFAFAGVVWLGEGSSPCPYPTWLQMGCPGMTAMGRCLVYDPLVAAAAQSGAVASRPPPWWFAWRHSQCTLWRVRWQGGMGPEGAPVA